MGLYLIRIKAAGAGALSTKCEEMPLGYPRPTGFNNPTSPTAVNIRAPVLKKTKKSSVLKIEHGRFCSFKKQISHTKQII